MNGTTVLLRDGWILVAAAPVIALWALWWRSRSRRRVALPFSATAVLPEGSSSWRARWWRRSGTLLRCAAIALFLLALARPQSGRQLQRFSSHGIDIVIVLDTSHSMMALDLDRDVPLAARRNRLTVARDVVREFINGRPNDQIGLVVFGETAFTRCPLTLDHGIVREQLAAVEIGVAGEFTAIGDGLATALKRLQRSQAKSKVIVLLTDGRNNRGAIAPIEAAEAARALGVKIYAIGAGSRQGSAPYLVADELGKRMVYRRVDLDSETLDQISRLTGGASFLAEDAAALAAIYEQINSLEKSEIQQSSYFEADERFSWLVAAGLVLFAIEVVLTRTRARSLP